ncbi:MAG: hypothetical protein EOP06_21245, partial [Proteobacteria bacterium]
MIKPFLIFAVGIGILVAASAHEFSRRPESNELLAPPSMMKYFALGYNEVLADSFWIRVIQDFDTCGRSQSQSTPNIPAETVVATAVLKQRVGRCEMSWVYKMIDAITELAPQFRSPYSDGGVILSIAVDDVEGASRIYDKAVSKYPTDYPILYKAAYHFLYEVGDRPKAAGLLLDAAKYGAPKWVEILAARLYSKAGQAQLGLQVLNDFVAANPDKADDPHVKQRMAEIERDLAAGDGPEATPAP